MSNVLKAGEVYHYFANKIQPSGRCGNTSFALPHAYSYRAIIGKHFPQGVALSSRTYSNTTTRHQSNLGGACRHLDTVYVPDPSSVDTSCRQVQLEVTELMRKASVARSNRNIYISRAVAKVFAFNKFALWCESDLHIEPPVTDAAALASIAVSVKAENAKLAAQRKEIERQNNLDHAQRIAEWRAGANVYLPYHNAPKLRVLGESIQTSKGASIPLADAPAIWTMIQRAMRTHNDYTPGAPIGVYRLTRISETGTLTVGCHVIPFAEIEMIAKQLGLTS